MQTVEARIARLGIWRQVAPVVAVSNNVVTLHDVRHTVIERAWFDAMKALAARHRGERVDCTKADAVVQVIDRLYRQRRIDLAHARILRIWGERGTKPNSQNPAEMGDARLWAEVMAKMDYPLRCKGLLP